MKVQTITVMERKNLGNYEHIEITASAQVAEHDDAFTSLLTLKVLVHAALEGKAATMSSVPTAKVEEVVHESVGPVTYDEETKQNLPVEEVKKEKKTRTKKVVEVVEEGFLPELPKEIKEVPSIPYNRDLDTHRQLLSSFLNYNHPSWKTTQGVKEFSMSLVGRPFLNADGEVVESFAKLVGDFFNA